MKPRDDIFYLILRQRALTVSTLFGACLQWLKALPRIGHGKVSLTHATKMGIVTEDFP